MNEILPKEIQSVVFPDPIWGIEYEQDLNAFVLETRDETVKTVTLSLLPLQSMAIEKLQIKQGWWEKIISVDQKKLYILKYENQNDPSRYLIRVYDLNTGEESHVETYPEPHRVIDRPVLYDHESEGHRLITKFLAMELVLPCEYLEFGNNIIISYYLRSQKGFERFLLLLSEGEKVWKIRQDRQMKGFADGAFFVVNKKLIFIRDRNEMCIYSL